MRSIRREDVERIIREEHQTLFWASNFSIGVAIFSAVNKYLAGIMNQFPQYDVEMEETHHVHKLDAPSGTAITLADEIVERLDRKSCWKKGTCTWDDGHVDGNSDHNPDELLIDSVRHDEVTACATMRCRAYTPSATTPKPTASPSVTLPTHAKALPLVQCSLPNSPKPTRDCSPQATSSSFRRMPLCAAFFPLVNIH